MATMNADEALLSISRMVLMAQGGSLSDIVSEREEEIRRALSSYDDDVCDAYDVVLGVIVDLQETLADQSDDTPLGELRQTLAVAFTLTGYLAYFIGNEIDGG